ncbi:MAG: hypothetical protein LBQ94_12710 [Treponema sp.]|jgi:hypothetical protein|nr:hypothetical protein [Treponema sp.]
MKKQSFLLAMLAILLAFGLAFVSCDDGTTGGGNTPGGNSPGGGGQNNILVGTKWVRIGSDGLKDSFEFISNTRCIFSQDDGEATYECTYTLAGNTVTILYNGQSLGDYTISGNTLIGTGAGGETAIFTKE